MNVLKDPPRRGTSRHLVAACMVTALMLAAVTATVADQADKPARDGGPVAGENFVGRPGHLQPAPAGLAAGPDKAISAIFADDFESGFPGATWTLYNDADVYWDDWSCWATSGQFSVGAAAGGGFGIDCGDFYPIGYSTWMVAGPVSLADPAIIAAELQAAVNVSSEQDYDQLLVGVSIDGSNFYGDLYDGTYTGQAVIDLSSVFTLGNIIGEEQVWIGFRFHSDFSGALINGAQVDDVTVLVETQSSNQPPAITLASPDGGETLPAGTTQTITWNASDPDGGPQPLQIGIDFSSDGGNSWSAVAAGLSNSGSYQWTVPAQATTAGRIRVRASDGEDESNDVSAADFTITTVAPGDNTLVIGTADGTSGTPVTVAFGLDNEDPVKGWQLDIIYDPALATFTGAVAAGRGAGMTVDGAQVSAGRARILGFHDDATVLGAGTGTVAELTFNLTGPGDNFTTLIGTDLVLSGPDGQSLTVAVTDGRIDITPSPEVPTLQLALLPNPGRVRSLQILVLVTNGSGNAPAVAAAGSSVTLSQLGTGLYQGTVHAADGTASVTVTASDTNANGTGNAQATVTF